MNIINLLSSNYYVSEECNSPSPAQAELTQRSFKKIVVSAALDAGVDAAIIEHFSQRSDHPLCIK